MTNASHVCMKHFFLGPRSIWWSHWRLLFWTSGDFSHGLKTRLALSPRHDPGVTSGATLAFLPNRNNTVTFCAIVADWPTEHLSCKQQRAGGEI